ncbi:MAG: XdhC family protein, partial [Clostridiales bacterium]|nr:XdhC family protein [Clostridiales bacterium]
MNDLLSKILQKYQDGDMAVMATVIQSTGSTPRGAGARMAVFSDGASVGTIGGGAVEYESQKLAAEYLAGQTSAVKDFYLQENEAADLGMICGGDITVHYQYLPPSEQLTEYLSQVVDLCKSGEEAWILTAFDASGGWSMAAADADGQIVARYGAFEAQSVEEDLLSPRCILQAEGEGFLFCQPLKVSGDVFVFGSGHVSYQLVPFLDMVFFPCTVVDDSADYANRERFPHAKELVVTEYAQAFGKLDIGADDYIVILTRGHSFDYSVLAEALKTPARYIGMIGSRKKIDAIFQ